MAYEFKLLGDGLDSAPPVLMNALGGQTAYQKVLAKYRDPLTPPHTRTRCTHTFSPIPGVVLCDSWATEWSFMEVTCTLIVSVPTPQDLANAVEECLRTAAAAAALSALVAAFVIGPGAAEAAKATFVAALKQCLEAKISGTFISIDFSGVWTDWA